MPFFSGNTYPVRDKLQALGGKWNPALKSWYIPEHNAEAARKLIETMPATKPRKQSGYTSKVCKDCGCKINYGVYCGKCEYR